MANSMLEKIAPLRAQLAEKATPVLVKTIEKAHPLVETTLTARARLVERIAPHFPPEDLDDHPDLRSFWQRLADADTHRSENPTTLWASGYALGPSWELSSTWSLTHWGIGVELETEQATPTTESHVFATMSLGPYWLMLMRTGAPADATMGAPGIGLQLY